MLEMVTSKNNPLIKHYRKLCENKHYRYTYRLFVVEGLRIVRDALQENIPCTILMTETAMKKYSEDLQGLMQQPESFRMISDEIGEYISDTEHTQGVFAICGMRNLQLSSGNIRPDGRYLVLEHLQDTGNMGMILRTADAMGMDAVISCGSCEIYNPKTVRATMGAIFRIPVYEETEIRKIVGILQEKKVLSYGAVLREDAVSLSEMQMGKGCAVWIGNEGNGLSNEAVEACDKCVIIPMRGRTESLNAAMAAGIMMWEMVRHE